MRIRIYPYRAGSQSAKELRDAFGLFGYNAKVLRREGSRYTPRETDVIINWGASELPAPLTVPGPRLLNPPTSVAQSVSKMATFDRLADAGVPTLIYTRSTNEAQEWCQSGSAVYARAIDQGHSGNGITRIGGNDMTAMNQTLARFWTRGVRGREYRVHVVDSRVMRVQKRFHPDDDGNFHTIRSHENGYTYIQQGFRIPHGLRNAAVHSLEALGLDFGAVDLIFDRDTETPRVLEVNTAIGMEGSTAQVWANAIATSYFADEERAA